MRQVGRSCCRSAHAAIVDTDDGTLEGDARSSGHDRLFRPSGVAVDPVNGDVYVSDVYMAETNWGRRVQRFRLVAK